MKKIAICISMILILLLSACTQKENNIEVTAKQPTKEPTQQAVDNSAYEALGKDAPADGLVLLVNNPSKEKTALVNVSKSITLNDTEEHILIIPKKEDTRIEIWSLEYVDDKLVCNELSYKNEKTGKNFVLDAEVTRPEVIPQYKMLVYTPDAYAEYIFAYDGENENPETEYISATIPESSK